MTKRAVILFTLFLLAAIHRPTQASGPVDSCALVTAEELSQIIGGKIGAATPVQTPRPHCTFSVAGKGMLKSVAVWAYHESAKIAFENGKTGLAPIKAVPALGDEAYWGMNLMNVLKGDIYLQIQLIFPKGVDAFTISKKIAEQAVTRLPGAK